MEDVIEMAEIAAAPKESKRKEDRHFVTALARGLDVLACFRAFDSELAMPNSPSAVACRNRRFRD
jgi:hypothetical protein